MRLVEQINRCLHSGDYSRALDLLQSTAAEFPDDAQRSELEKLAHDGVKRNAEANRLITESQELFAQQKSAEAIQLLRNAYELDKRNSLARAILANALVEHAHSVVQTDWLEAETLTNQALALNPAHPTAKTVRSLIVEQKKTSSVEDWVAQARKLHSSGDLFAALAWVAEGLAVHPDDPKLLQIHNAIQRDEGARRRQARRGDLEDLRRMELEIEGAADAAAKQALAARIQAMAAKYWTDGEILSVANRLLQRMGVVPQESSTPSPHSKASTVIFHVPRPTAPQPSCDAPRQAPSSQTTPTPVAESQVRPPSVLTATVPPSKVSSSKVPPSEVPLGNAPPGIAPAPLVLATPSHAASPAPAEPSEPPANITSRPSLPKQPASSKLTTPILISAAAILLVATTFFLTRKYYAAPAAKTQPVAPAVSAPPISPAQATPSQSAPAQAAATQALPEPSLPPSRTSSDTVAGELTLNDRPPAESVHKVGALLVAAGQDGASVFLNGKLQPQLTQAGELRLPNLELKDYVVQVSKSGFQDPPPQRIRIRKGEEAKLVFNLQPQPRLASLAIRGGDPGTTVLVDQTLVGTIQPDGTLFVSTINPGDHIVELRKERFKPRQFKKSFAAGETISLAAVDAALEAAPAQLKITFTPADAKVAISKGELPTIVSSGVPLNLAAGTYTLTARTGDGFTRLSKFEIFTGQFKTLDLSLAPNDMSKWDDPGDWKQEGDSFTRKGGGFVLYEVVPTSGTFAFSAMLTKGHILQWVLNYSDEKNYVLLQMDDNDFYRTVIRNGEKTDEIKVPDKGDKKHFRALQIRVSPTEIVHQIRHGDVWTVLDRWTEPGLSLGKFGFYIPGDDQVAIANFAHYADLNIR
jgi:hypothetical protein